MASCRRDFLQLLEEAHGLSVSRLLGELDINSAQCLIQVNLVSVIERDSRFLSVESRGYAFDNETSNLRDTVKINLQCFVDQMTEMARQTSSGKRQLSNGE
jgi:hypothetical protein